MSANAKRVVGELASPPTVEIDRTKLAEVKEEHDNAFPDYPFRVYSKVTGHVLARFAKAENADGFIHNIALEVLQRG